MFTGTGNILSMTYDGLRRLTSVTGGQRTSKTVNGTTYRYYYTGGKLMRMTWGTNTIDFFYDANGTPYAMKYNGTAYYYITNLQGDVMRIVDGSQNIVTSYDYDPYGKVISATGTLANINPLRYRGYVYDQETGFYYLQSRYYDPTIGRFINADAFVVTTREIPDYDLFTYCHNNPIILSDSAGYFSGVVSGANWGVSIIQSVLAALFAKGTGHETFSQPSSTAKEAFSAVSIAFIKALEYSTPCTAAREISRKANRTYAVYWLKDEKGIVRYVGRVTDDGFDKRIAHHLRTKKLSLYYSVHGLDWLTARGLEEVGMVQCHTINLSDPVANHIHGVGIFNKNGGGYFEAVMDYLLNHAEESFLNLISW